MNTEKYEIKIKAKDWVHEDNRLGRLLVGSAFYFFAVLLFALLISKIV